MSDCGLFNFKPEDSIKERSNKATAVALQTITGKIPEGIKLSPEAKSEIEDISFTRNLGLITPARLARHYPKFKEAFTVLKESFVEAKTTMINKAFHKDLRSLVKADKEVRENVMKFLLTIDGKSLPNMPVKMTENSDSTMSLNDKHYEALSKYLQEKGATKEEGDLAADVRRSLDKDSLLVYHALRKNPHADQSTLEKIRSRIGQVHNYFPHRRKGNYFFKAVDPTTGETKYREHFKAKTKLGAEREFNQRLKKIKEEHPDATNWSWSKPEERVDYTDLFGDTSPLHVVERVMESSLEALEKQNPTSETIKALKKAIPEAVNKELSKGFRGHLVKRHNIPGFQKDNILEVLFDYKQSLYGTVAKLDTIPKINSILKDVKSSPNLYRAIDSLATDLYGNEKKRDAVNNKVKTILFFQLLGFNLKTATINSTQNLVLGIENLGMDTNLPMEDVGRILHSTFKDIADTISRKTVGKRLFNKEELQALRDLKDDGTLSSKLIDELRGKMAGVDFGWWETLVAWSAYPMTIVEKHNRTILALAAYKMAKDGKVARPAMLEKLGLEKGQKADHETALKYAKGLVDNSHLIYGKLNRPEFFRSGAGSYVSSAYTFLSYPHQVGGYYLDLLMGKEGGAGRVALMKSLMALVLLGGLESFPLYDQFASWYRQLFGYDLVEDDLLKELDNENFWKETFLHGLPYSWLDIDLGGSLKFNIPGVDELRSDKTTEDNVGAFLRGIIGAPMSLLNSVSEGAKAIKAGQKPSRIVEAFNPNQAMTNMLKAFRLYSEGDTSVTGQIKNFPGMPGRMKLDEGEATRQALGYTPKKRSQLSDVNEKLRDVTSFRSSKLKSFSNQLSVQIQDRNMDKVRGIAKEIASYNAEMIERGTPEHVIASKDLGKSLQNKLGPQKVPKQYILKAVAILRQEGQLK
jgi:hypothetical protein